eukprot:scaffold135082_cov28-Tisochrysis_lutea.AAC.1
MAASGLRGRPRRRDRRRGVAPARSIATNDKGHAAASQKSEATREARILKGSIIIQLRCICCWLFSVASSHFLRDLAGVEAI